jgi:hypothetical protein
MTSGERRSGIYLHEHFDGRPYVPPHRSVYLAPPEEQEWEDEPNMRLWYPLVVLGMVLSLLLGVAMALGLALLILTLGTELLRKLGVL